MLECLKNSNQNSSLWISIVVGLASFLLVAGDACQPTHQSYIANDGLVLISTGNVITFQPNCPKDVIPAYAVLDGHSLIIVQHDDGRTYQISWTNDFLAATSYRGQEISVYDENGYQQWKKTYQSGSPVDAKPLFNLPFNHQTAFTGPLVRTEFVVLFVYLIVTYTAINLRFKIMNKQI